MKKFRATLSDGPMSNNRYSFDMYANNTDEVFAEAYKIGLYKYKEVTIEEIPEGPALIGVEFSYTDTASNSNYTNYLIIKANSENEAKRYYNNNYKGKRFWFNPGKIEANGKNIYGRIKSTYFAACISYDADATINMGV